MYQLLIGYDREKGRKDICFWPVNPGEMIGRPECTDVSSFSQYNGFTVGGRMIYDIMADRSNETKADLFELRNKAGSFARQYLRTTLWEEDIELENGSETYQLVFRQGICNIRKHRLLGYEGLVAHQSPTSGAPGENRTASVACQNFRFLGMI